MPARTGAEYLQGLKERPTEVWLGSERIGDVTTHPALRRGARSGWFGISGSHLAYGPLFEQTVEEGTREADRLAKFALEQNVILVQFDQDIDAPTPGERSVQERGR